MEVREEKVRDKTLPMPLDIERDDNVRRAEEPLS
jgi:hypothetical protein